MVRWFTMTQTLYLGDCAEVLRGVTGASLVHADPPWTYSNETGQGSAAKQYATISMGEIAGHLDGLYDSAGGDAYLIVWCTWPKLSEWMDAGLEMRWSYKTGGSWHKTCRLGIGYHVRSDSEPWLIYTKGRPKPARAVSNAFASKRGDHSVKPQIGLRRMLRLVERGSLVVEPYAGLGSMALACRHEGMRYVGAEIDPARHAKAMAILSQGDLFAGF